MTANDFVQTEPAVTQYDQKIPGAISSEYAAFLFILGCSILTLLGAFL
jgi:hypothetical protein